MSEPIGDITKFYFSGGSLDMSARPSFIQCSFTSFSISK